MLSANTGQKAPDNSFSQEDPKSSTRSGECIIKINKLERRRPQEGGVGEYTQGMGITEPYA